jgi:hypothetical protein
VSKPSKGPESIWGAWAWIALGITVTINLGFYAVIFALGLFHGAAMGKLAGAFNILSAALIFGMCHALRPRKGADA